jgi:hypothetical protein
MILALISQLASAGVPPQSITVCDTLARLVNGYYALLHGAFSAVRYENYAGGFQRFKVQSCRQPMHWSSRPRGKAQDDLPACFALTRFHSVAGFSSGSLRPSASPEPQQASCPETSQAKAGRLGDVEVYPVIKGGHTTEPRDITVV